MLQSRNLYQKNREYILERQKKRYNPERKRRLRLQRVYNISSEHWDVLFEEQNKSCAICKSIEPGGHGVWHTDHCHTSDKIRGILCSKCNHAIGLFQDNVDILKNAIKYLENN